MTLLGADITHNTKSCYKPETLEEGAFRNYITGFTNPGQTPVQLIQKIFDENDDQATMLKTNMMVTAYIPNSTERDIPKLFKAMKAQSKHVSKNKLSSAARTLPTLLSDWLKQCSPRSMNTVLVKTQPVINHRYTIQTAMDARTFATYKVSHNEQNDTKKMSDITMKDWLPKCITNSHWENFIKNPFEVETLHHFTKSSLTSMTQGPLEVLSSPPYRITFKSITANVLPIKKSTQRVDVRHMNAYQIIPGLVYTLHSKLNGELLKDILNKGELTNLINYITRYCYATRTGPSVTMHAACQDYKITLKQYLNSCEGNDEVIPVTVLLVSMYNACYSFQSETDKRDNLLSLALGKLEHGGRGSITEKAFVRTMSE